MPWLAWCYEPTHQGAIVHTCASVVPDQIVRSWRIVKSEWTTPWLCQTYFYDSRKVDWSSERQWHLLTTWQTRTVNVRETQTDENVGDRIRGQGNYCPTYLDMVDRHTMKGKEKRRTEYRDLVWLNSDVKIWKLPSISYVLKSSHKMLLFIVITT